MESNELDKIVLDVEEFKAEETQVLNNTIINEIANYKQQLPEEILTPDFQHKVDEEVQNKLVEFKNNLDINPRALYHALKVETELNEEISKTELKHSAYDFLEKSTKNKFLKKIIKELKKEL